MPAGVSSHTHTSYLPDGTVVGRYGRAVHSDTREVMAIIFRLLSKTLRHTWLPLSLRARPHPQEQPTWRIVARRRVHNFGLPKGTLARRLRTHQAMGNGKGDAQRRNAHVPRQALREALLAPLAPGTVRCGRRLQRYEVDADGVTLHFQGEPAERASVLVGADGIWSTVQIMMIIIIIIIIIMMLMLMLLLLMMIILMMMQTAPSAHTRDTTPPSQCVCVCAQVRRQLCDDADHLRYLGVVVILGRATCHHPLAHEQVLPRIP